MSTDQSRIILITGIMASGKSTVAQHLAEQFPRSVHLRGDSFRRMIVKGRLDMGPDFSQAAFDQLRLRYQLAATTARMYRQAGFTVVYQDVILGAILNEVVESLKSPLPGHSLHVFVLCPSPEIVAERDKGRHKQAYSAWSPAALDQGLRSETPRIGLWLDTSAQSVDETVTAILAQLDQARV